MCFVTLVMYLALVAILPFSSRPPPAGEWAATIDRASRGSRKQNAPLTRSTANSGRKPAATKHGMQVSFCSDTPIRAWHWQRSRKRSS